MLLIDMICEDLSSSEPESTQNPFSKNEKIRKPLNPDLHAQQPRGVNTEEDQKDKSEISRLVQAH